MIGAIAGDIIGSIYEWTNIKTKDFLLFGPGCHFSDDSVLAIALADTILNNVPYVRNIKKYF
jgi:ADP-ribosylglycohydrolase